MEVLIRLRVLAVIVAVAMALGFSGCSIEAGRTYSTLGDVGPAHSATTSTALALATSTLRPSSPSSNVTPHAPEPVGAPSASGECRFIDGGTISGTVTYAGRPVRDGSYVMMVFSEALATNTVTEDGRYELRLLARECEGRKQWLAFRIHSGGDDRNAAANRPDMRLDLHARYEPVTPALLAAQGAPVPPPECDLALGVLRGHVTIGGVPAPDGTEIVGVTGIISTQPLDEVRRDGLDQVVRTRAGQYELTTIGDCQGFAPMTVHVGGTKVVVQVTGTITYHDIVAP